MYNMKFSSIKLNAKYIKKLNFPGDMFGAKLLNGMLHFLLENFYLGVSSFKKNNLQCARCIAHFTFPYTVSYKLIYEMSYIRRKH